MRRRDLLAVLGGAAVAAPVAARAQQKAMPVIGYLAPDAPSASASGIVAWREGLAQGGFVESQNVVVEYRSGNGDYGRMPALGAELGLVLTVLTASSADEIEAVFSTAREKGIGPLLIGIHGAVSRASVLLARLVITGARDLQRISLG